MTLTDNWWWLLGFIESTLCPDMGQYLGRVPHSGPWCSVHCGRRGGPACTGCCTGFRPCHKPAPSCPHRTGHTHRLAAGCWGQSHTPGVGYRGDPYTDLKGKSLTPSNSSRERTFEILNKLTRIHNLTPIQKTRFKTLSDWCTPSNMREKSHLLTPLKSICVDCYIPWDPTNTLININPTQKVTL